MRWRSSSGRAERDTRANRTVEKRMIVLGRRRRQKAGITHFSLMTVWPTQNESRDVGRAWVADLRAQNESDLRSPLARPRLTHNHRRPCSRKCNLPSRNLNRAGSFSSSRLYFFLLQRRCQLTAYRSDFTARVPSMAPPPSPPHPKPRSTLVLAPASRSRHRCSISSIEDYFTTRSGQPAGWVDRLQAGLTLRASFSR